MSAYGIDYIELYVGDVTQATHYYRSAYGFTTMAEAGPLTGLTGARSTVLVHGDVRLVLTSGLHTYHPASRFVRRHGDGVRDVALRTDDAEGDFARAVAAGATPVAEPKTYGHVTVATVAAMNDLVHTFVQRRDESGPFLPGIYRPTTAKPPHRPLLRTVDHLALCLLPGTVDNLVGFYERTLGLRHTYSETIEVGDQTMNSKVVQDETRAITFTMVEPDPQTTGGQLTDFLDGFDGPGVQHVAFGTTDIVATARDLRKRGVEFLSTPAAYYASLAARGIDVGLDNSVLQELGLLVDRDEWGRLMQIFTRSPYDRRTVFFELIQRLEARTFGSGNIKALYEAVERERERVLQPSGGARR